MPDLQVGERSATTVALVVHELATNSVKYGALSAAAGRLDVTCAEDNGEVVIVWRETGGPPLTAPANPVGFGAKLVRRTVSGQLGGSIAYDWPLRRVPGHDEHGDARIAFPHMRRHGKAVHRPGHLHVGEQHVEGSMLVEQPDSLVAIARLDHLEALLFEVFGSDQADQAFILDEQNPSRHVILPPSHLGAAKAAVL